jgi:enoyl-CoA hydratase/carnithine racemase
MAPARAFDGEQECFDDLVRLNLRGNHCLDDEVFELEICRGHRGNALNSTLVEALLSAIASVKETDASCVILTAQGKNICTGFDLKSIEFESDADLLWRFIRIEQFLQCFTQLPMRTVCIASDCVYGAGADIFAMADHRIASSNSKFSFSGTKFGIVLDTRRLVQKIGQAATVNMVLDGRVISADEAFDIGLVHEILDEEDAINESINIQIEKSILVSALTVGMIKKQIWREKNSLDLAALVESACVPGLGNRIRKYVSMI